MLYHIAGNIDMEFNLTVWRSEQQSSQINIHQYEFSLYYKPLVLYHFVKLKFVKCYFEVNLSNLFPINISGYTVCYKYKYNILVITQVRGKTKDTVRYCMSVLGYNCYIPLTKVLLGWFLINKRSCTLISLCKGRLSSLWAQNYDRHVYNLLIGNNHIGPTQLGDNYRTGW